MMLFQRTVLGYLVIPGRGLSEVSAMVVDSFDYSLLQVSLWSCLDAGCGVCFVEGSRHGVTGLFIQGGVGNRVI